MNQLKPVTAAIAALAVGLGFAATSLAADEQLPEVVVEAGPTTKTVVGRSPGTNAPIEQVTVDYHVHYSDLDLVKHADVMKLHERIETAARAACRELDELFPIEKPQSRTCIQEAVRTASRQIETAVAAAAGRDDTHPR